MTVAAPPAPATHTELAHLISCGDRRRAAALLVRDHAPAVFSLCRAMVRDDLLAEDLSQDVFARAFGALEGFRGEASPRTWLLRIARNRCLDHLERARRAPWGSAGGPGAGGTSSGGDPDDYPADDDPPHDLLARREDAERAMAVLAENERALVVLHFGHGVGYPELADSFGLREGAVRMRISRALGRMRAALVVDLVELDAVRSAPVPVPSPRALAASRAGIPEELPFDAAVTLRAHRDPDLDLSLDDADESLDASVDESADASDTLRSQAALLDEGVLRPGAARAGTDLDAADLDAPTELSLGDDLETVLGATPDEALGETAEPLVFPSLRDDVPSELRARLDELAAGL